MMAAQPPHSVHEKSRSPSDSRRSSRFRPRLELLEDRLPLGDTVLGLSVVTLAGLGFSSLDAPPLLGPTSQLGFFSYAEDTWVLRPASVSGRWPGFAATCCR